MAGTEQKQPSLADQYDFGEESEVQNKESTSTLPGAAQAPEQASHPAPAVSRERDESGRFVKSSSLVSRAKRLGFSDEEIADVTPAELRDLVNDAVLESLLSRRQNVHDHSQVEPQVVQPQLSSPESSTPTIQQAPTTPEDAFDLGVENEADYVDGLIPSVKKHFKAQAARIRQLEERVNLLLQGEQARVNETLTEQLDRAFAKHETHLGKGKRNELKPDSVYLARRRAVLEQAKAYQEGSLQDKVDRAVSVLYGQPTAPTQAQQGRKLTPEEEWLEGGLAHPTQRYGSAEPQGREKAVQTVANHFREMSPQQPSENLRDDFPGR